MSTMKAKRKARSGTILETLPESVQRSSQIIDFLPDATFAIDTSGKVIAWNRAMEEMAGVSAEEMLGKGDYEYSVPFYGIRRPMLVDLAFKSDEEVRKKYSYVKRRGNGLLAEGEVCLKGERRAVWGVAGLLYDEKGNLAGSIESIRDVSEAKQAEKALQAAHGELEQRVEERTAKLLEANLALRAEIAERKKAEDSLRKSEQRFRALFEDHGAMMFLIDTESEAILDANEAAAEFYGFSRRELCAMNMTDINQAPSEVVKEARSSISKKERKVFVFPHRLRNGEIRTVEVHSSSIEMGGRSVLFSIVHDITERQMAFDALQEEIGRRREIEAALRESEAVYRRSENKYKSLYQEFQTLLDAIPDSLELLTPDLKAVWVNRSFAEKFGKGGEVIGKTCHELVHGRQVPCDNYPAAESFRTGQRATAEVTTPSGEILEVRSVPVIDENGRTINVINVTRDITESKILASQLVQAQKLESIGQLAAGIAHEINTPAQYVGDNAIFLQEAFQDLEQLHEKYDRLIELTRSTESAKDIIDAIESSAEQVDLEYLRREIPRAIGQSLDGIGRISKIVRAMKEFSHPGTEGKTNIDMNSAIESTITVARNEWKYVAEMVTDLDPDLPPVACLPGEINQVILNMIINATHAVMEARDKRGSDEKGTISIDTRAGDGFA